MSESSAVGVGLTNLPAENLSPGLATDAGQAFELKFRLSNAQASEIEAWARRCLTPDAHGDQGLYSVVSLYCDTAEHDVYRRSPGFKRSKLRVRRYGESDLVFLERKSRKGDQVRKKRVPVPAEQLAWLERTEPLEGWTGCWFRDRLHQRALLPACRVSYRRTAFFGLAEGAPVRLTIDRDLRGGAATGWELLDLETPRELLPGEALLEMKFHLSLPGLFRDLLPRLPAQVGRVSKFRTCMERCGLAPEAPAASQGDAGGPRI